MDRVSTTGDNFGGAHVEITCLLNMTASSCTEIVIAFYIADIAGRLVCVWSVRSRVQTVVFALLF